MKFIAIKYHIESSFSVADIFICTVRNRINDQMALCTFEYYGLAAPVPAHRLRFVTTYNIWLLIKSQKLKIEI